MAVKINKDAKKLLEKREQKIEAASPPPVHQPTSAKVQPIANDPEKSCIAALRVFEARRGHQTLVLIRKKDGKPHEVVDFNPTTGKVECRAAYGDGTKFLHYTFPLWEGLDEKYTPLWR